MTVFNETRLASASVDHGALAITQARPMGRLWERPYVATLVGLDLTAAVAAVWIASWTHARVFSDTASVNMSHLWLALALPAIWVVTMAAARAYEPRYLGLGSEEFRRIGRATVWLFAAVATYSWGTQSTVARGFVVIAVPLSFVLTVLSRYAARKRLHRMRAHGRCMQRVIAVGHPASVAELVRQMRREQYHGLQIIGACVPASSAGYGIPSQRNHPDELADLGIPVLGGFDDVVSAVARVEADTVAVLGCQEMDGPALRRLGWDLEDTHADLVVAPVLMDVAGPRIAIRPACGLPLLHVEEPEFRGMRRVVKRLADACITAGALLLLSPVLAVIALAVKLTSKGPVLFTQTRVGRHGDEFRMLKFRTMSVDAEERLATVIDLNERSEGLLFKIRNDPRVTPVGRILRKYSLDELPQLFNILRGEMSLVGPRPPLPSEVARYSPDVRRRLLVKPGLTGLWQISGRSDLSWDDSVRLDLRYVENWSLSLDFLIVWKTFFAVVRGSGAY
jgi:exopolysaccharide biosynthesis polyprenyl glycosylphosphotransferase